MAFTQRRRRRDPVRQSILGVAETHTECNAPAYFSRGCGVFVCDKCGEHEGLVRCFCGWAASGGNGRQELRGMGENVEDDY